MCTCIYMYIHNVQLTHLFLATFHLTCTVEVAIEDVSEGSNQNQQAFLSSSKSCGHSCEAESQALCCICTVEQGAVHATEDDNIIRALSNCSLCQRLVRLRASNCMLSLTAGDAAMVSVNQLSCMWVICYIAL